MGTKPVSILSLASRCNPSNRVPDACSCPSVTRFITWYIYIYEISSVLWDFGVQLWHRTPRTSFERVRKSGYVVRERSTGARKMCKTVLPCTRRGEGGGGGRERGGEGGRGRGEGLIKTTEDTGWSWWRRERWRRRRRIHHSTHIDHTIREIECETQHRRRV